MQFLMGLLVLAVPVTALGEDGTISKVVSLLQEMLEQSKSDGVSDRTVYAKFKCYCDTTTEKKSESIATTTNDIEMSQAVLADLRAQNTKLSQEVAQLEKDMASNQAARDEATTIRDKEKEDFAKEESDLTTGIDQLDRAVQLLAAIGADQTVTGDTDSAQLLAGEATAAAGGPAFLTKTSKMKKGAIKALSDDVKAALRAASVNLSGDQRTKLTKFLQAPFTGNYNAQSGEIVGVLKNMLDTFKSNLENARSAEEKAQKEYDALISIKTEEYDTMSTALDDKKKMIGDNAANIATESSEVETMQGQVADDQEFLGTLSERCASKKKAYEKRNMLRANEEAAIAEAISILNSDAAFESFGKVESTSAGRTSLLQISSADDDVRHKVIASLVKKSETMHSSRITLVIAALKAENPFTKVLEMIEKTITVIAEEEKSDVLKKDTCKTEQDTNNANKEDKESDISTLEDNINSLEVSITDTKDSIETATSDLQLNRESQKSTTETRDAAHAQFSENLKNLEDAEKILHKATEVLQKYYAFLHSHNAVKTYAKKGGKDSGGGNMERLAGKSIEELEEACSETPECVAFNSAGWLKSSLAPEGEWYDWDGGDLYIKELSFLQTKQPLEGEPDAEFATGQGESGNKAIDMLVFIADETKKSKEEAIEDEKTAQGEFESEMQALTTGETNLVADIDQYKLDLATSEKQLEEAKEDLATTTKEHAAIVKYLAEIEPGCTFIQTNYETRKSNREAEKTALEGAIDLLKNTPAFQAAVAAQDKEDLGKCAPVCEEEGADHAKCLACQEGVTVFGYCSGPGNSAAPGCSEATATGSADALN
jgi:septal ring factor EnvC (AmiA/AmiB activator)